MHVTKAFVGVTRSSLMGSLRVRPLAQFPEFTCSNGVSQSEEKGIGEEAGAKKPKREGGRRRRRRRE